MPRTRKRHTDSPEEKARWAFEVIRGERSLARISSESGVHPNVLRKWRDTLLAQGSEVFVSGQAALREQQEAHERETRERYAEIGQLTPGELAEKEGWRAHPALNGWP